MAPRSSTVVSATGDRIFEGEPAGSPPSPDDLDLESDLSLERRKERLVRLPNHLKPWIGKKRDNEKVKSECFSYLSSVCAYFKPLVTTSRLKKRKSLMT